MCHWIVPGLTLNPPSLSVAATTNLPHRSDFALAEKEKGKHNLTEIMPPHPPTPPPKTGFHRYVFVLLAPEEEKEGELRKPKGRQYWGFGEVGRGVEEWAGENGLVAVGAEFFYSESGVQ